MNPSKQLTTRSKWPLRPMVAVTLSVFSSLSYADNVENNQLSTIEVTAAKPTTTIQTLNGNDLSKLTPSTSDTAALLKTIPGLSLYSAGGVSSLPAIRGLADDRLRIKVNGANYIASCPNHMNSPLSYIDPSNVDKIEVSTGATLASVSGDSIGGTILVDSAKPIFANQAGEIIKSAEFGTFYRSNGQGFGANATANIANDKLSLKYSGAYAKSDNYHSASDFKLGKINATVPDTIDGVRTLANNEVGESRYETTNHELALAYRKDNHLFDAKLGFQHIPNEGFPNQRMDMTDNQSLQLNLGYNGSYQWGDLEARAYRENTRHKMDFDKDKVYQYGIAPGMPMDTKGSTTGVLIKGNLVLSDSSTLKTGVEYQAYRLNDWWPPSPANHPFCMNSNNMCGMAPNTFQNINNGKRDRLGLFADWDRKWNAKWQTIVGARIENVSSNANNVHGYNDKMAGYSASAAAFNAKEHKKTDVNMDLNLTARYLPTPNNMIEIGAARKTRSPNLYERYSWSKHSMALEMNNFFGDGNGYVGNVDLKPETAQSLTATYSWKNSANTIEFKFAPYYTEVKNYIDVKRCQESGMMMQSICSGTAKNNSTATGRFVHLEFVNANARLYGIDVSAKASLLKHQKWGDLSSSIILNYVRGKNTDTGDNLYNIMPLNSTLALNHHLKGWDTSLEWQLVKGKKDVSTVRQELKTAGYGLLNFRTGYTWKNLSFNFGIENLLNKQYSLPLGGAYVGQGYTMSFNGENGSGMMGSSMYGIAVPGAGRSFYVGLKMKF